MACPNTISIRIGPINASLSLQDSTLSIKKQAAKLVHLEIPHRNVLRANFDGDSRRMTIAYMDKNKRRGFHLVVIEGQIEENEAVQATKWAEQVMTAAYDGVKRSRRLMVFVNPFGGTKQATTIFMTKVEPILKAAGCSLEVIHTTRQGHAYDVTKALPLDFDAVITVSGDGLVHEVLNGFAHHADPMRAFATPVAPIPTGSGNALSLNLLGIDHGFDIGAAALNAVKGKPMKVDLFSLTQSGKRSISFMSQSLGLMADLDIGTEHLRWMGETRFMYGLLRGLLTYKSCPIQLSYKVVENDKDKMAKNVQERRQGGAKPLECTASISSSQSNFVDGLPPLRYLERDDEGWTTFDDPILYVYAGKGPYVGRDLMAFPVSLPDDGLIDVMVMPNSSRLDLIGAMDGAPEGVSYWHPKVHYVKAHAYKVKPLKNKGHFAVDGEPFPFEEYQVEVHQGLGTLLSPYGHYAAPFEPRKGDTPPKK